MIAPQPIFDDQFFPPRFDQQSAGDQFLRLCLPGDPSFLDSPLLMAGELFDQVAPLMPSERQSLLWPLIREHYRITAHDIAGRRLITGWTPLQRIPAAFVIGLESNPTEWPGLRRWYGFRREHRAFATACTAWLAIIAARGDLDLPDATERLPLNPTPPAPAAPAAAVPDNAGLIHLPACVG